MPLQKKASEKITTKYYYGFLSYPLCLFLFTFTIILWFFDLANINCCVLLSCTAFEFDWNRIHRKKNPLFHYFVCRFICVEFSFGFGCAWLILFFYFFARFQTIAKSTKFISISTQLSFAYFSRHIMYHC